MFNKIKKIPFYVLVHVDNQNKALTYTKNKKEACEYALAHLKTVYFDHFKRWCAFRNIDVNAKESWDLYVKMCIDKDDLSKYLIKKGSYTMDNFLSVLRMFTGCIPLGCSFDTQAEYEYLSMLLNAQKEWDNAIKNIQEDEVNNGTK